MNIFPFAIPDPAPHERFCAARAAMMREYQAWLREMPPADDVALEVDGTIALLAMFRILNAERREARDGR